MPSPSPDWDLVPIRGRFAATDGTPISGRIIFTPKATRMLDPDSVLATTIIGRPIQCQVTDGLLPEGFALPATDDPDKTPVEFTYEVKEDFPGGAQPYNINVPLASLPDGIDLGMVAPVPPNVGTVEIPLTISELNAYESDFIMYRDAAAASATAADSSADDAATSASEAAASAQEAEDNANGFDIGTVTTTASGADAEATITGTAPNRELNLVLPRGLQGIQGIQGEQGVEGPQGIQGVQGPIGPAGLNWQGLWSAGTDYVEDDAVSYDGASWFASEDPPTGAVPSEASPYWHALSLRGAQGIQGIQGPQGEQGIQGVPGAGSVDSVNGDAGPNVVLTRQNILPDATTQQSGAAGVGKFAKVATYTLAGTSHNIVHTLTVTPYIGFGTVQVYVNISNGGTLATSPTRTVLVGDASGNVVASDFTLVVTANDGTNPNVVELWMRCPSNYYSYNFFETSRGINGSGATGITLSIGSSWGAALPAGAQTAGAARVSPIAELPTGTTSTTVALGNHNHDSSYVALTGNQTIAGAKTFSGLTTVGTVAISEKTLNLTGSGSATTLGQFDTNLRIQTSTGTVSAGGEISFRGSHSNADAATGVYAAVSAPVVANGSTGAAGHIIFSTKTGSTTSGLTERMRIANDGAVTIANGLTVTGTISGPGSGLTALNASNLGSGTVPDARLTPRLAIATSSNVVTDWNNAVDTGWYSSAGASTPNAPDTSQYFTGRVERFSSQNVTQTLYKFTSPAYQSGTDTQTYRRVMLSSVWGSWYRVTDSQAELDARYAMLTGNQTIAGTKTFSTPPVINTGSGYTATLTSETLNFSRSAGNYLRMGTASGTLAVQLTNAAPGDTTAVTFSQASGTATSTFAGNVVVPDGSFTIAKTTGLQTALNAKADNSAVTSSLALKANLASPTFSGTPVIPNAIFDETSQAASGTSGTVTLDLSAARIFTLSPTGNVTTLTISNVPASGRAVTVTLIVSQGATSYSIATPSGGVFMGAATPTQVANKACAFTYVTTNGGTTWYCSSAVQV